MNPDISDSENATVNLRSLWSRAPLIAFGAAVSAFAIYAIASAPEMWRTAERIKAEQLHHEDRMFCEKFRMPPDSEGFETCVGYLTEIRRRHGDKLAAEAAGML
jgi:hypothetical protein